MDSLLIEALELECIIGVRPAERRTPQLVRVDLDMGLELSRAAQSGRIAHTVDYSQVAEEVAALLGFRDYQLLEVAAEETCAMLFGAHAAIERISISIQKPAALKGRARSGGVHITRERRASTREIRAFGAIEVLLSTHEADLRLLHVEPGESVAGDATRCIEWLVAGHIEGDGKLCAAHEPRIFATGRSFTYVNSGRSSATIFSCLHRPSK